MMLASCMKGKSVQENISGFKRVHHCVLAGWLLCALAVATMSAYLVSEGGRECVCERVCVRV
jgi:hypothetical protein